jgi:hypothetical protein
MKSNQQKKKRISLDKLKDEGRLKGSGPDIAEVWGAHKKSRKKQSPSKLQQRVKKYSKSLRVSISAAQNSAKVVLKSAQTNGAKKTTKRSTQQIGKKKYIVGISSVAVLFILVVSMGGENKEAATDTLGAQAEKQTVATATDSEERVSDDNQVSEDQLPFEPLFPEGVDRSSLKTVVRKSPSGSVIFTVQQFDGNNEIQITEQEMPENFLGQEATEIEKMAKELQAVSVIQIDENKIYHGLSENTGVQTLITSKNELLIFIRSNVPQSDDYWMSYYLSLK